MGAWGVIGIVVGALALLYLLYAVLVCPSRPKKGQTQAFLGVQCAHRGLYEKDQSIPENTLAAFARAVEGGYGVELDVQLSKDGAVVVFHDDTVDRMTTEKGRVDSFPLSALQSMSLKGTAHRIPLFVDVSKVLDGHAPTIVELKSTPDYVTLCEKTLAILRTWHGPFCVESFDPHIVRWFYRNAPDILRGQLTESYAGWRKYNPARVAFSMSQMLFNRLAHPQFIAYGSANRPLGWRLGKLVGTFFVYWTERPDADHAQLKARYDCLIFEHFRPEPRFAACTSQKPLL